MGYTADKAYLTRDQPQTEFTPLNKAKCSIFDEFSKFLYLNKVTLKSGRYQKLGKKIKCNISVLNQRQEHVMPKVRKSSTLMSCVMTSIAAFSQNLCSTQHTKWMELPILSSPFKPSCDYSYSFPDGFLWKANIL